MMPKLALTRFAYGDYFLLLRRDDPRDHGEYGEASAHRSSSLFTTCGQRDDAVSPLGGQVHGFGMTAGRPGDRDQPLDGHPFESACCGRLSNIGLQVAE
jgi:hypothetical protein